MTKDKRLLRERERIKKSRPKFRRVESWRLKRLKPNWRKPDGIDSKVRHHKRGWPKIVRVGYRGPKAVRGLTATGMEEVLVHNRKELEQLDKDTQVARIASPVGVKKKVEITNRADELDIKIINRPEAALTFATISEISEELLEEEEALVKEIERKTVRKKKPPPTKPVELTDAELAELEEIESAVTKERKTTKSPTTKKVTEKPKSTKKATKKTKASSAKKPSTKSTSTKKTTTKSKKTSSSKKEN